MATTDEAPPKRWLETATTIILVGVILAVLAFIGWQYRQARRRFRAAARLAECERKLKNIGVGMRDFADAHGRFPSAYVADEDGRPMHSWRVLVLPNMEEQELYEQYDFDQPWDDPDNLALAENIAAHYLCPSAPNDKPSYTNYVMIVGPGTISDGPNSVERTDITDGTSHTIMVVEVGNSGINCLEPRDLNAEKINYRINDPAGEGISSCHPGGAAVLFCDGSVRFVKESTDPKTVKALTTIAGGEDISSFMEPR
jgi:prepilin-type processing-associated H-X9-DG protein